jgi:hypothetical protein
LGNLVGKRSVLLKSKDPLKGAEHLYLVWKELFSRFEDNFAASMELAKEEAVEVAHSLRD